MFDLFNKKKKHLDFVNLEKNILTKVIGNLPKKYYIILFNDDLILDIKPSLTLKDSWFSLLLDRNIYDKHFKKELKFLNFRIEKIMLFDENDIFLSYLDLRIFEGFVISYRFHKDFDKSLFNYAKFDEIEEVYFNNEDLEVIKKIIEPMGINLNNENFDFSSSFKIRLNKNDYYTIKDFEDGNYLAIDKLGVVYFLIHDPYKVKQLDISLRGLNDGLNNKTVDLYSLYNKQLD